MMLDRMSIIYLLRLVFHPYMWSILEMILCSLEKNVHSGTFGWNDMYITVKSYRFWCVVQCHSSLTDFMSGCSMQWCYEVLKVPYFIVLLAVSPCSPVKYMLYILRFSYVGNTDIYNCYMLFLHWSLPPLCNDLLCLVTVLWWSLFCLM